MTQERTPTAEQSTTASHTAEATAPMDSGAKIDPRAATDAQATNVQPLDTRALRDAQSAPQTAAAPADRPGIGAQGATAAADVDAPLFAEAAADQLRERWITIQTEFVDSPRAAVEKADSLVAETLKQLTETFARERDELEAGWSNGSSGRPGDAGPSGAGTEPSTEELRQAIRRYRSFFNRLLSV